MAPDRADALTEAIARLESDPSYMARLKVANALDAGGEATRALAPIRVAVLRDMTVEPIVPVLRAELARAGFRADVWLGDFDTIGRDVRTPGAGLYEPQPDVIVMFRWLDQLAPDLASRYVIVRDAAADLVKETLARLETELTEIRARSDSPLLITNFPLPDAPTLGILDSQLDPGQRRTIASLNDGLLRIARNQRDVFVVDVDRLVASLGARQALDERGWQTSRAPFAKPLLLAVGAQVATFVRALRGKVRKCIVLDCDGTLWGGIVGEDGIAGIRLDPSYPGSGFMAFQQELLNLRERGILLAIVSKNNEADALEVLRDHPHMLIREEHLAAWRINWQDKAANLMAIAEELNIGLDSIVFADDSPFECESVRQLLPEVAVLELGSEPSRFRNLLIESALFDSLAFTADDRGRAATYVAERRRRDAQASAGSLDDFLRSLEIEASMLPPGPTELPRIAQLTQKTNQFNLTTIRYTEGDISRRLADPASEVIAVRLKDRFADLGLIGVAILDFDADRATIDTLLLSCRVLGRGVEDALLSHIAAIAMERGMRCLRGSYLATARNGQVEDFFERRGFVHVAAEGDRTWWELDLGSTPISRPEWISMGGTRQDDP